VKSLLYVSKFPRPGVYILSMIHSSTLGRSSTVLTIYGISARANKTVTSLESSSTRARKFLGVRFDLFCYELSHLQHVRTKLHVWNVEIDSMIHHTVYGIPLHTKLSWLQTATNRIENQKRSIFEQEQPAMSDFKKTNLANPEDNGYPDLDLECSSSAVQTMATNANQDGIQKNDKPTKRLYPMATFAMGAVVATLVTLVVVFLLQQDKSDSIQTSVSSALTVAPSSDQTFLLTESNQAQLIEAANQTEEENQDKEPPIEIPIQDLEEISPSSFRIRFHGSKEEHTDPPVSQETRIAPPRCDGPHYHDSYIVTDHTARWRVRLTRRAYE